MHKYREAADADGRAVTGIATAQSFARLLRRHRHDAGLTLEELSEASGVSIRAISNMELGHSLGPQRATVDLIASSLGLGPHDRAELLSTASSGRRRSFEPAPAVLAMPRGVTDFVGRSAEVATLTRLLSAKRAGPAPVVVVSGTPGVGKTSFAVHAAAELADAFPDGQLFLDLRGLDEHPLEPTVILGRLINAVAPSERNLPHDAVERAGFYRTLLAGRRVLIVLDNAADESQVRLLLPGDGLSMMVITSRRRLTGLETAHRLALAPLTRTSAVEMLTNLVGEQVADDATTVERLAELSGHLPLALRLIGHRLASHPDTSSARFAQRLGVEERRLETLTAGDMRISAVFMSSYVQLSADTRRLFRRLALVPAADTGPAMAAVLADMPLESTEQALDELVEFGLLQTRSTDRYRLHDLVRLFARTRLDGEESAAEVAAAQRHVEGWLLSTATVAGRWFQPDFASLPPDWDDRVPMENVALAEQWLVSEADNWLAAVRTAAQERRLVLVVAAVGAMSWFADGRPHWGHWTEVFTLGSSASDELGDPTTTATQLAYLSWSLNICDGDSPAAAAAAERSFAAAKSANDVRQQGVARYYKSLAQYTFGDHAEALATAQDALRLSQQAGDPAGLSLALGMAGRCYEKLGRADKALETYRRQLTVVTEPATAPGPAIAAAVELSARAAMGRLHKSKGDWTATAEVLRPIVEQGDTVAIPRIRAVALVGLGEALCESGRCGEGITHLRAAEALYRRLDNESEAARIDALLHTYAVG
jgi:transcriptional regulator with XRE-family HTH domain/tetratricopeptide (TPR) repeat protein